MNSFRNTVFWFVIAMDRASLLLLLLLLLILWEWLHVP